jgi:carboxypeptidase D
VRFDPSRDPIFKFDPFTDSRTFSKYIDEQNKNCNYAGYLDKYLKYPPTGLLPLPGNSTEFVPGCDIWSEIVKAASSINPGFNIYRIFDMVWMPFSPTVSWK